MTYRVTIVRRQGAVDGWVVDLPGCRAIGGSVEDVQSLLPAVIAEHLMWLKSHGENAGDPWDVAFGVVQDIESSADVALESDLEPLTTEGVEIGIRRSEHAFADLIARGRLPDAVLDWRPPVSAVKIENFPDVRSIREMLAHASGSSGFFVRNVGDREWKAPPVQKPEDVLALREAVFARLRGLTEAERNKLFTRPDTGRGGESGWTARKLIRRLINHERFHTKEIEQRLAWLLLAVPDVMPISRE